MPVTVGESKSTAQRSVCSTLKRLSRSLGSTGWYEHKWANNICNLIEIDSKQNQANAAKQSKTQHEEEKLRWTVGVCASKRVNETKKKKRNKSARHLKAGEKEKGEEKHRTPIYR